MECDIGNDIDLFSVASKEPCPDCEEEFNKDLPCCAYCGFIFEPFGDDKWVEDLAACSAERNDYV